MSSRCLATDALMLAPWKIFPGVCSFMHCCTTGVIKLLPWRKVMLNERHAKARLPGVAVTTAEAEKSERSTTATGLHRACRARIAQPWTHRSVRTVLRGQAGDVADREPGTGQLLLKDSLARDIHQLELPLLLQRQQREILVSNTRYSVLLAT